jgi:hypothetical protein
MRSRHSNLLGLAWSGSGLGSWRAPCCVGCRANCHYTTNDKTGLTLAKGSKMKRIRWYAAVVVVAGILGVVVTLGRGSTRAPWNHPAEALPGATAAAVPRGALGSNSPPPSFVSTERVQRAEHLRDPASPDYNPRAALVLERPIDLFGREPRNDAWAAPLERALAEAVHTDLARIPGAESVTVECKTTACKFAFAASRENMILTKVLSALYGGTAGGGGPYGMIAFYKGGRFGTDIGDPDALFKTIKEVRDERLANVQNRYHGGKGPRGVPSDVWPER